MLIRPALASLAIAACATLAAAGAAAQDAPEAITPLAKRSMNEVIGAIAKRYQKPLTGSPSRSGPRAEIPTIVLTDKATPYLSERYDSPAFRVIDEKKLISEQRAVFILISQIGLDGDDLMVDYNIPNTASYGSFRMSLDGNDIKIKPEESFRSSSGSRATYAQLYGGLACRDNSEMAWRYNFYSYDRESGTCPKPSFPASASPFD